MSIEKPSDPATGAKLLDDVDASPLIGTWCNTNAASTQIACVRIQTVDGRPMLDVWGSFRTSPCPWGQVPIGATLSGKSSGPPGGGLRGTIGLRLDDRAARGEPQQGPADHCMSEDLSRRQRTVKLFRAQSSSARPTTRH